MGKKNVPFANSESNPACLDCKSRSIWGNELEPTHNNFESQIIQLPQTIPAIPHSTARSSPHQESHTNCDYEIPPNRGNTNSPTSQHLNQPPRIGHPCPYPRHQCLQHGRSTCPTTGHMADLLHFLLAGIFAVLPETRRFSLDSLSCSLLSY